MTHATSYARLTKRQARTVLTAMVLMSVAAVAVTLSPLGSTNLIKDDSRAPNSDVFLYRAEVDRIQDGEGYYQAVATELTTRGYPTKSVFNWRMPLPVWLLGKLPTPDFGKAFLGLLALALLMMAFEATAREEEAAAAADPDRSAADLKKGTLRRPIACTLLLIGALLPTVLGDLFTLPVLWSGVWIGLSICAYGIDRPRWGVFLGLAALFFRELALPYCVLCIVLAWRERKRSELAVWLLGLAAWLVFFGLHYWIVSGLIAPDAHAHQQGWIRFGGAGFVISTAQMNTYLLLVPQWLTAIYLVAALVGIAGWNTPLGTRVGLATCLFLVAFAIVGHSFNQYWGCMIAPLLCFGAARFPASLSDLCHAAEWPHIRNGKAALSP